MATMKISLSDLGKRYNREWIFRHLNFQFEQNHRYAITGSNGSGKSTLLQILGGLIHHSEGEIAHILDEQQITSEKIYSHVAVAAPYIDMPDEFSFQELLAFHFQASVCPAEIVVAEKQSQGRFMVRGVAPELVPVGAAREVNDRVS